MGQPLSGVFIFVKWSFPSHLLVSLFLIHPPTISYPRHDRHVSDSIRAWFDPCFILICFISSYQNLFGLITLTIY